MNVVIKILQGLQLLATLVGIYFTPIQQCPYGIFVFAIGSTHAVVNLIAVENIIANNRDVSDAGYFILQVMDSIQDYAAVGLINLEFYHLSSKNSLLGFAFCIVLSLDLLAKLFRDDASQRTLNYLKKLNMVAHSASISYLADQEFNIWFHCVWAATLIISSGIYYEASENYRGRLLKLIGYNVLYMFSTIGIYDDDFLVRLEWFRSKPMDY